MDERLVYTNYMSLYDMPGAGVIDNNYLYYICLNNNKLIKYNLLLGEIEKVYYIPIKNCKWWPYREMCLYQKKIFLIPHTEKVISVLDLDTDRFYEINDDIFEGIQEKIAKFRHCLQEGRNLWLVSAETKQVFVLDMDDNTIEGIDLSECNCTRELGQVMLYGEYIYIVSRDEDPGVRIHRENKTAYVWEPGREICYGAIVDGNIYYASAKKDIGGIWRRNIVTGDSEVVTSIIDDSEIKSYRYWNTTECDRKVCFLPVTSKEILMYDIDNKKIEYIDIIGGEIDNKKTLYDLIRYNDGYVVIPYCGEEIVVCASNFIMQKKICNKEEIKDFVNYQMNRGYILENKVLEINGIMKNLMLDMGEADSGRRDIGNQIHRNIMKELD